MPVVINEFELAPTRGPEEATGQANNPAGEAGQAAAPKTAPAPVQDVERIIRRQRARLLRVAAY